MARCGLRKHERPGHPVGEAQQQAGVILRATPMKSTQLCGDGDDPLATHELREVQPVRADIGDRP